MGRSMQTYGAGRKSGGDSGVDGTWENPGNVVWRQPQVLSIVMASSPLRGEEAYYLTCNLAYNRAIPTESTYAPHTLTYGKCMLSYV